MSAFASALDSSVLVLNKMFMAVQIVSVRRAFVLLVKELAEVVSMEDGQYATYDFSTWREVSEYRSKFFRQEDDDWVRTVSCEIQVPRVIRLVDYDRLPKTDREVQPKKHFCPRQQPVPVLWQEVSHPGTQLGPYRPAQSGWREFVGEYSVCLRWLQCTKGWPNTPPGQHAPYP